jgi:hypothetical protein
MVAAGLVQSKAPRITGDPRILIDRASAHYINVNESYPGLTQVSHASCAMQCISCSALFSNLFLFPQENIDPPIYTIRGFLTPAECKLLQEQGTPGLARSVVVDGVDGISTSKSRTSSSCSLLKSDTEWLVDRITSLTGRPGETQEPPQVARYNAGEFYKAHLDAFDLTTEAGRRCYLEGRREGRRWEERVRRVGGSSQTQLKTKGC